MQIRLLGRSGLRVSEVCLGAMTFGGTADEAEAGRILDRYAEAGGNFVDTASNYTDGSSEEIVGRLAAQRGRDGLVIATKYTGPIRPGDANAFGNHRKNLVQSLDQSLRRLQTDYIDLLWVHIWDATVPVADLMRALDDQVRAGKVLHVGISDAPAWVVARGNTVAELRGWSPFCAIQVEYSLVERSIERELAPMADALGLGVLAWGPQAGGLLTGKYAGARSGAGRLDPDDRRMTDENFAIVDAVREVAADAGATPGQVALAWMRAHRPAAIPIVGARSADQLGESLDSLDVTLSAEHLARLEEASAIPLGFPHDMLARFGIGAMRPAPMDA